MLFLYDNNVYKLAGKDGEVFTFKNPDNVDQLNMLQVCNCIENLYFDEKAMEHYIKDLAQRAAEFLKANIPYSHLAMLEGPGIELPPDPKMKNLAINGMTEESLKMNEFILNHFL